MLVQMERQIDREIAADNKANGMPFGTQTDDDNGTSSVSVGTNAEGLFESDSDDEDQDNEPVLMYGPQPQIITNDLKSLDEMVSNLCVFYSVCGPSPAAQNQFGTSIDVKFTCHCV